jgi:signal transduction histidine kinase
MFSMGLRGQITGGGLGFGDLKVRPKLIVLHNAFFLVLTCAVYFSLIPLVEERIAQARSREMNLVAHSLGDDRSLDQVPGAEIYEFLRGTAEQLAIPAAVRTQLDAAPGRVAFDAADPNTAYLREPNSPLYRRVQLPNQFYEESVRQARWTLLIVLAVIYVLAVLLLELLIMPRYVYRPIRAIIGADEASQHGDVEREIIPDDAIPGDEVGQIMRSRNATVARIRQHERELEGALAQLAEVNQDLIRKNYLLETAKRSIADQDRLVSLGMLSASVAHEINTPLAVLHGSIEKMMETAASANDRNRLSRMLRVTERLRKMSETLLDFARARREEKVPVPVRVVVEESWQLVAIDEKAMQVTFENRVPEHARIHGDADRMVQLFVNLIRNALQAVPAGGRVRVTMEQAMEAGRNWWVVSVEDNGPGIPEDTLPNIFEAFVTTRLDARGTGLGLTVAEGIVTEHGGSIQASNLPEGGACLQVKLPAAMSGAPVNGAKSNER